MDYYDFVASAIAAVASLYNANAELAHLQKIGVKDVCVLWCGSTLQNNNYLVSANDLTTISLGEQDTVTSVLQNIAVILSTPKGTVPCYREFGIDIANILDRPENVAQPMLCAAIKEAIERFEPRATYMGTTFKEAPDTPGRMLPVVEVSISA